MGIKLARVAYVWIQAVHTVQFFHPFKIWVMVPEARQLQHVQVGRDLNYITKGLSWVKLNYHDY